MSLTLTTREVAGVSILDVTGRVTLGDGAGELREALKRLTIAGHKNIVLNLAALTVLDSTGIGVLVSSFATIGNAGGRLKLLNLTDRVKDLMLITKLYTVFEIFDSEAAAVASFPVAAGANT